MLPFYDISESQIAAALGVRTGTVKSQLSRALVRGVADGVVLSELTNRMTPDDTAGCRGGMPRRAPC